MLTLPAVMCETREPGIEFRTGELPVPALCLPADKIPAEPGTVAIRALATKPRTCQLSCVRFHSARLGSGNARGASRLRGVNS